MDNDTLPINSPETGVPRFAQTLDRHGIHLIRDRTHTLQINVGLLCNQTCRHCHLDAGPTRTEIMSMETVGQVIGWAARAGFQTVDITGGAPELNPHIGTIVAALSEIAPRLIFRSNLTAISKASADRLVETLRSKKAVIVASFPSTNEAQLESQRGNGIFLASINSLKRLNALGYGIQGSSLELNLVSNPSGAFLASNQKQAEQRFRRILNEKWGIEFNNLYSFSNAPLGRFRRWLERSGSYPSYMKKLADAFNPDAVEKVMCRSLVSISWNGFVYDCDFNLSQDLPLGRKRAHVSRMKGFPEPGSPIATADHCYSCTAGSGFT